MLSAARYFMHLYTYTFFSCNKYHYYYYPLVAIFAYSASACNNTGNWFRLCHCSSKLVAAGCICHFFRYVLCIEVDAYIDIDMHRWLPAQLSLKSQLQSHDGPTPPQNTTEFCKFFLAAVNIQNKLKLAQSLEQTLNIR